MTSDLRSLLLASGLREAMAAIEHLDQGSSVQPVGALFEVTGDFVATYRVRAKHLGTLHGTLWQRMVISTTEFADNLASQVGRQGRFFAVGNSAAPHFVVLVVESPAVIAGCMWVVPAEEELGF